MSERALQSVGEKGAAKTTGDDPLEAEAKQQQAHTDHDEQDEVSSSNVAIVFDFLGAMAEGDGKRAAALLDPEVEWRNTGLPTIRGRRAIQMIRSMENSRISFDVVVHAIASEGDIVLTDRTDVLAIGPVRTRFWVCGTFKVRDGLILTWDDHFSFGNVVKGLVSGFISA